MNALSKKYYQKQAIKINMFEMCRKYEWYTYVI